MRKLLEGLWIMERPHGCNTYLVGSRPDFVLVDAGTRADPARIESQMLESGFLTRDIRRIVITHAHGDHLEGAPEMVRRSGARILCSREEVPYVQDGRKMPTSSLFLRFVDGACRLLCIRRTLCGVDEALEDGQLLGGTNLRVVSCPGHTPGSISLYDADRRILFCGAAMFNVNPLTGKAGLLVSIPAFTTDRAMALESVRMLSRLSVDILLPGHGEPILERGGERIRELLSQQDKPCRVARGTCSEDRHVDA
jgi:glyoxylase-like metal-dependent hydrolase (beta-lactamase superfamily II)